MSVDPKTALGFNDLLEGLTGKPLYSCLCFITVKRYRLKSAKAKGAQGRVQERPGGSFQLSLPVESYEQHLILPATMCDKTY